MARKFDRRDFLVGAGVTGSMFVAGCLGGGDGEDTETTGDGGGNGGDGTTSGGGGNGSTTQDGGGGGGSADRDSPIRVGVLLPLTGDLGELGVPIKDGAILPFAQLDGQTDFTLEQQVEDTQTDPNAAQSAAQALVNAGFPAVTGAASSGVSLQVYRNVFIPNGIAACSPASTSPEITDLNDNNLIYRTPPTDALQGQVLAQVATEQEDASTASTLYVNNSYGQLLSDSFAGAFEERDGTVQNQVSFQSEQSSYVPRLESALSGDPDALVIIGYPASGVQMFRDFYANFNQPDLPIFVTDGLREPSLPANVDNAMENVKGTAPLASGPGTEFFNQLYRDEYGREPGVFTAQAYDATACLMLANAAAGENNGAAVAEQMRTVANGPGTEYTPEQLGEALTAAASGEDINYQGASSAVEFNEQGDLEAATYELFSWQESDSTDSGWAIESLQEIEFQA
ncbi:ABC transporter substrate-binding protein [Halomarina salina]|uniref:ABC transporter substrate-binding protein n=1 Tax=Halomarina salina TaxID=1872699 RepID=A0ABD5RQY2_9EURY|nr:ABC transporter substrate-binding protein [Halomarina salina]